LRQTVCVKTSPDALLAYEEWVTAIHALGFWYISKRVCKENSLRRLPIFLTKFTLLFTALSLFTLKIFFYSKELVVKRKFLFPALALTFFAATAQAQTEIQWWHSMSGALGDWVGDIAKDFNSKQTDYKIVPVFKGNYDESMTAAVAAFRAGNAPHI
jgi:hypothetical protein